MSGPYGIDGDRPHFSPGLDPLRRRPRNEPDRATASPNPVDVATVTAPGSEPVTLVAPGGTTVTETSATQAAVPDTEEVYIAKTIALFEKLFGVPFTDKNGFGDWLRAEIKANHGEIRMFDSGFFGGRTSLKQALAQAIYGSKSTIGDKVTDAGLDYFFGDQNGALGKEDTMSLATLIDRLKFMVPVFQAQEAGEGENAIQLLRTKHIVLVDFSKDYLEHADFKALKDDDTFKKIITAFFQKYQSINDPKAKKIKELAIKILGEGEWNGKIEDREIRQLIFAAFWGNYKTRLVQADIEIPYEELEKGTKVDGKAYTGAELTDAMFRGVFMDYLFSPTHDLPVMQGEKLTPKIILDAAARRDAMPPPPVAAVAVPK